MSKHVLIDWQHDSLLVATSIGRNTLSAVSLQAITTDSKEGSSTPTRALVQATTELGVGKVDAIVVLSREVVEVRTISVPRIDPNELPDVIRFQAQRQLANMGDSWTLDYVMLPDQPGQEMLTALVGAVSPAHMAEVESACAGANLQLSHVALRPIEIARFALASGKLPSAGAAMVVCLSEQSADLLILTNGHVALVRSTKLPTELAQLPSVIPGEIRRSIIAASSQLGSNPVEHILLLAAPDLAALVEGPISDASGVSVSVVDPGGLLGNSPQRESLAHSSATRIAALAGASTHASADKNSKLDFKNPKKRPPKKKNTLTYLLAAAAAVALVAGGANWWVNTNKTLDAQLLAHREQIKNGKGLDDASKQKIKELQEIEQFLAGSPNFLDELTYIVERIPPAEKVIMEAPTFSTLPNGSGQIRVAIATDTAETISQFEASLRDENHKLTFRDNRQLEKPTDLYKWEAVELITIVNRGWKPLEAPAPSKESAAPASTATPGKAGEDAKETGAEIDQSDAAPPIPDENKNAGKEPATTSAA